MNGYIEYDSTSIFSPEHLQTITVGSNVYKSASHAIQSGEDPQETILLFLKNNRDTFISYRKYVFVGTYSSLLNDGMHLLFGTRYETVDINRYVRILDAALHDVAKSISPGYSIPVVRNVYTCVQQGPSLYQQVEPLDMLNRYRVFLIENIPLYVGHTGSFLLLDYKEQDVSNVISALTHRTNI